MTTWPCPKSALFDLIPSRIQRANHFRDVANYNLPVYTFEYDHVGQALDVRLATQVYDG